MRPVQSLLHEANKKVLTELAISKNVATFFFVCVPSLMGGSRQVQVLLPYETAKNKHKTKKALKKLKSLDFLYGLAVFQGRGCLLITFRTTARASGKMIHILQMLGVHIYLFFCFFCLYYYLF